MKTKLIFQMINLDDDYIVDPNSIFINGWLPNWNNIENFLFKKDESNLPEIIENIESGKTYEIELDIWEDSDDFRTWIDFTVLKAEII